MVAVVACVQARWRRQIPSRSCVVRVGVARGRPVGVVYGLDFGETVDDFPV